jgi:NAD(P)-dependent dehydrogenase (short-subunit alcohol dehydrogenase family)
VSKWTINDIPDQTGRVFIITGANSGLGYESTLALARKNARIVMACRNMEKGEVAAEAVRQQVPQADLDLMQLDLASLDSIHNFAAAFQARYARLDVLMNNAGVMAIPRRETTDGFEMQFGVNHLGHFALTGRLLPLLLRTPGSRVVTVSSMVHLVGRIYFDDLRVRNNYSRYCAYGQSKLANVLFAFELQRRLAAVGNDTISVAAHPGYAATELQSTSTTTSNATLEGLSYKIGNNLMAQSAATGAVSQLRAAVDPGVQGGEFWGPRFTAFGQARPGRAQKNAYDPDIAARLWQRSEELTGVRFEFAQSTDDVTVAAGKQTP